MRTKRESDLQPQSRSQARRFKAQGWLSPEKAAEMRAALEIAYEKAYGGLSHLFGCDDPPRCTCGLVEVCAALDSDAGKGWVSPEVAEEVRRGLVKIEACTPNAPVVHDIATELLAALGEEVKEEP